MKELYGRDAFFWPVHVLGCVMTEIREGTFTPDAPRHLRIEKGTINDDLTQYLDSESVRTELRMRRNRDKHAPAPQPTRTASPVNEELSASDDEADYGAIEHPAPNEEVAPTACTTEAEWELTKPIPKASGNTWPPHVPKTTLDSIQGELPPTPPLPPSTPTPDSPSASQAQDAESSEEHSCHVPRDSDQSSEDDETGSATRHWSGPSIAAGLAEHLATAS